MRSNSTAEISSAPIRATTWLELSPPQFDPEKKTNPRTKTMMTANSVHLSWWKLARMVLSIPRLLLGTRDYIAGQTLRLPKNKVAGAGPWDLSARGLTVAGASPLDLSPRHLRGVL